MGQFGRMSESVQRIAKPYVLKLPKAGNTPAEYEDAAFVQRSFSGVRLALADGASAAVFAGAWARMLARTFARRPFWTVAALRYRAQKLGQFWRWQHAQLELPWYAEQKLADGAAATLIGVTITLPAQRAAAGSWQSLAVGDACLFQMRDRALVQMHPDLNPAEFGNAPALVYSVAARNHRLARGLAVAAGSWRMGDTFVLASDALAKWIRTHVDSGQGALQSLYALAAEPAAESAFSQWALQEQGAGRLKNDDHTMVLYQT